MRLFVLTSVLLFAMTPRATGQRDARWLILPVTSAPDDTWLEPTASRVRTELSDHGVDVWSLQDATRQFEALGSAPAAEVTEGDIQQWVDQSSKAIRNLAEGDYTSALEQLNEAQTLSRSAAEELNREHERAQRMLDTCLYMVRVLLDTRAESRARSLARECRQLVPRVEPTAYMHPPGVVALLREVDASRAQQPRKLKVENETTGCAVRINGVMLGETPLELRDLFPGEYRVQVECEPGRRGRVHTADVTTGSTSVLIDLRFDQAVSTQPTLHLHYESVEQEVEHHLADAERVTEAVPAGAILLLSKPNAKVLELELVGGTPPHRRALARVATGPGGPSRGDVALASRALLQGKCTDFIPPEPVALPCGEEQAGSESVAEPVLEDGWPAQRTSRGQFISGLTLAGLGTASLFTGYGLLLPLRNAANEWFALIDSGASSSSLDGAQNKWLNVRTGIFLTSSVGGAALVAAMPLALPRHEETPWFAWLSGGLGVGLAAFSIAYGVTGDKPGTSCTSSVTSRTDADACVVRAQRVSLSVLAGVTAAPLLTIPLVYLFRPRERAIEAHIEGGPGRGYFGLKGEF